MAEYEAGVWDVDYSQVATDVFAGDDLAQLQADAENVAVNLLWNFTGRIFGTREIKLRPQREVVTRNSTVFHGRGPYVDYPGGWGYQPVMIDGHWLTLRCGSCPSSRGCTCISPWSLELPGNPIEVLQVVIDGEVMPSEEYWLDGHNLVRLEGYWPQEQNMRRPSDQPGTWFIEYTAGLKVPKGGQVAAGILATELGKAALQDNTCALPSRVQTVTRQGVTMAILDTFDDLAKGRVGIPRVDMWVQSVNQVRSAATIASSPDVRR